MFPLLLASFILLHSVTSNQLCFPCRDGTPIPEDFVNVSVTFPGYEDDVSICGDLQAVVSSIEGDDVLCQSIQSIGTLCGCPTPYDSCTLCPDGSSIPRDFFDTLLTDNTLHQPIMSPLLPPQCGFLEASLSLTTSASETCRQARRFANVCGCPKVHSLSEIRTPSLLDERRTTQSCALCRDGVSMMYPDKDLSSFLFRNSKIFENDLSGNFDQVPLDSPTCQGLANMMAATWELENDQCRQSQFLFAGICGCPPVKEDSFCTFCPNDEDLPDSNRVLSFVQARDGGPLFTCSELNLTVTQVSDTSDNCFFSRSFNFLCGCNEGSRHYVGADMELKQAFLAWIPRVTGLASLVGSLWIITDIIRDRSKHGLVFNQLMVEISIFDCFSSVAWIFSTAPIPKYENGEPTGVYGAIGNSATCTVQGFFVQFGLIGSLSVNVILTLYYLLVIVKSFREWHFKPLRKWFHGTPVVLALGWACAGIPFYDYVMLMCHVSPYPVASNHVETVMSLLFPIALAFLLCSINMGWIYWKVRKQSLAADRWRMTGVPISTHHGGGPPNADDDGVPKSTIRKCCIALLELFVICRRRSSDRNVARTTRGRAAPMERAVVWQATFYLSCFFVTWSFYFSMSMNAKNENYGFWVCVCIICAHEGLFWKSSDVVECFGMVVSQVLVVIFTPLQGFLNFIVYMRPRWGEAVIRRRERRRYRAARDKKKTLEDAAGSPDVASSGNVNTLGGANCLTDTTSSGKANSYLPDDQETDKSIRGDTSRDDGNRKVASTETDSSGLILTPYDNDKEQDSIEGPGVTLVEENVDTHLEDTLSHSRSREPSGS